MLFRRSLVAVLGCSVAPRAPTRNAGVTALNDRLMGGRTHLMGPRRGIKGQQGSRGLLWWGGRIPSLDYVQRPPPCHPPPTLPNTHTPSSRPGQDRTGLGLPHPSTSGTRILWMWVSSVSTHPPVSQRHPPAQAHRNPTSPLPPMLSLEGTVLNLSHLAKSPSHERSVESAAPSKR